MFWTVFYAAAAVLLFLAVVATFDRCLGRVPERSLLGVRAPRAAGHVWRRLNRPVGSSRPASRTRPPA
jgi:hypothetical protein